MGSIHQQLLDEAQIRSISRQSIAVPQSPLKPPSLSSSSEKSTIRETEARQEEEKLKF